MYITELTKFFYSHIKLVITDKVKPAEKLRGYHGHRQVSETQRQISFYE